MPFQSGSLVWTYWTLLVMVCCIFNLKTFQLALSSLQNKPEVIMKKYLLYFRAQSYLVIEIKDVSSKIQVMIFGRAFHSRLFSYNYTLTLNQIRLSWIVFYLLSCFFNITVSKDVQDSQYSTNREQLDLNVQMRKYCWEWLFFVQWELVLSYRKTIIADTVCDVRLSPMLFSAWWL